MTIDSDREQEINTRIRTVNVHISEILSNTVQPTFLLEKKEKWKEARKEGVKEENEADTNLRVQMAMHNV